MFYIIKGIEFIGNYIRIKCKILFWKLKYGKRIRIGRNLKFRKRFNINITNNGYLEIGDNNFFNNDCSINCHESIKIGDDNLFGENVKLYDHNHVFNNKNLDFKKKFTQTKVEIGNCNWIGSNVTLLSKTIMENHNVIAAGIVINEAYDSDNIVKRKGEVEKYKIQYIS